MPYTRIMSSLNESVPPLCPRRCAVRTVLHEEEVTSAQSDYVVRLARTWQCPRCGEVA